MIFQRTDFNYEVLYFFKYASKIHTTTVLRTFVFTQVSILRETPGGVTENTSANDTIITKTAGQGLVTFLEIRSFYNESFSLLAKSS